MPEKIRTRRTNLVQHPHIRRARGRAAPEALDAVGGMCTSRAPERRPARSGLWGVGPDPRRNAVGPTCPLARVLCMGRRDVRSHGYRAGYWRGVPRSPDADQPPAGAGDYAALSAGWGAALGTLLLAARGKGDEPVRPAEIVPLGVATFALSKLVAKEK